MYRTPNGGTESASGGLPIPSTASSSSSTFHRLQTQKRGLTPAQQPIHDIPPLPPLLPSANTARPQRNYIKNLREPEYISTQQAIILSQLFPEEWALLHPIYGGQGITALSLRSLPSPESLPISPPDEGFAELDLDAPPVRAEGGLPSIKVVLGEEFQWINWNPTHAATDVSPAPFSPSPMHSTNDEGLTLPPILHTSSFSDEDDDDHGNHAITASDLSTFHLLNAEQLDSGFKTTVYYPNSPALTTQQPFSKNAACRPGGRLPPPLKTLCIPPPSLDLRTSNHKQLQDVSYLSPSATRTIQKQRFHPYNLPPMVLDSSSSASTGSWMPRAAVSPRARGGVGSPLSSDGMNTGFNLLGFDAEGGTAGNGSRLEGNGGKVIVREQGGQGTHPAIRLAATDQVPARKSRFSTTSALNSGLAIFLVTGRPHCADVHFVFLSYTSTVHVYCFDHVRACW